MIYQIEPRTLNNFSNRRRISRALEELNIPYKFVYSGFGSYVIVEVSEADAVVLSLRRVGVEVGAGPGV